MREVLEGEPRAFAVGREAQRKREPLFFEREGQEAWGPTTTVSTHED